MATFFVHGVQLFWDRKSGTAYNDRGAQAKKAMWPQICYKDLLLEIQCASACRPAIFGLGLVLVKSTVKKYTRFLYPLPSS